MILLIEKFGLIPGYLLGVLFVYLRYLLLAGLFFWVLYRIRPLRLQARKIQQTLPSTARMLAEMRESALTAVVFAGFGLLLGWLRSKGYTAIYTDLSEMGYWYFLLSFLLLVILHDTYFYWMHRLLHHPKLFRILHRVHHQSFNPTPWAALAFHPLEAILEIAIIPVLAFIIPFHPLALVAFASWSLFWNILGHSGYELFPAGFVRHRVFKWVNTSTHHNMHHLRSHGNYGLYFNFWDRVMGTNFPEYEEIFERVKQQHVGEIESIRNHGSTLLRPDCFKKKKL